jgi:hypothetical protein
MDVPNLAGYVVVWVFGDMFVERNAELFPTISNENTSHVQLIATRLRFNGCPYFTAVCQRRQMREKCANGLISSEVAFRPTCANQFFRDCPVESGYRSRHGHNSLSLRPAQRTEFHREDISIPTGFLEPLKYCAVFVDDVLQLLLVPLCRFISVCMIFWFPAI